MRSLLITGGCGFIGSNFIRYCLSAHDDWSIINLDKLTYAGNPENLKEIEYDKRYRFIKGDICNKELVTEILQKNKIGVIVNFAAESHVDRSILDAEVFFETNVKGTMVLLEAVRRYPVERFIQISTDEVYGDLGPTGYFSEETPLKPNSPYAASKAGADHLVRAYYHTYGVPGIITRSSNNFGPYQFPEKLIPLMITNALGDQPLPVYGDGANVRDWLYVEDHCSALDVVIQQGKIGDIYNIGGGNELPNINLIKKIVSLLGKTESLITFVKDRPGHDRRYATDSSKLQNELGWKAQYSFEQALEETVQWYKNNRTWWERILQGDYKEYYRTQYLEREKHTI